MESVFAVVVGLFFATSIYLMLSKNLIRILIGVAVFGNAVNLFIFTAGRLTAAAPPILSPAGGVGDGTRPFGLPPVAGSGLLSSVANPLPQALILTAIVISFSLFAFLLVLAFRAFAVLGTDEVDAMREAEPAHVLPPLGY
jgi:multicomponent Na+:H+ antiporter subunit C